MIKRKKYLKKNILYKETDTLDKEKEIIEQITKPTNIPNKETDTLDKENEIIERITKPMNIIKLNIGGSKFLTSKKTLSMATGSLFNLMVNGQYTIEKDEEGFIFIDRSGKYFDYILNYLRDGTVNLPKKEEDLRHLIAEVEFYCMNDLKQLIEEKLRK